MTKFVCRNKDCKKYGVEVEYTQVTYRFVNGELRAECAECPECGQEREEINENALIPLSQKNVQFGGQFSSASLEQRREMLKKRSHEHYEKEIKPYKEHQLHEMVKNFKDASKG